MVEVRHAPEVKGALPRLDERRAEAGNKTSIDQMTPTTRMEGKCSPVVERILHLTLEMVYLLTGETPPTVLGDHVTIKMPSPHNLISEHITHQKILEVTDKITQLLTGEVLVRCQDVAVYFSMEERDYLEGHKDLYKDVMMEDQQLPLLLDGASASNIPETFPCPLYSQDSTEECDKILRHNQASELIMMRVEVKEETEEMDLSSYEQCMEEQISPDTDTDARDTKLNRNVESDDEEERLVIVKEEEISPETGTYQMFSRMLHSDIEDSITTDYPRGHRTRPNRHLTLHDANSSYDASEHGEGSSLSRLVTQKIDYSKKVLPCPECGKCFSKKTELTIHKRIHKGQKPYSCSVCRKCFCSQTDLNRHERVHTGEKPYACSECGKRFTQKSYLQTHERIHTGEKPYSCSECGKSFTHKSISILHERVHTGEKPYSCSKCGKCFTHKSNLLTHERVHTGEKPYSCSICGKSFSWKSGFLIHERLHAGKKPYSCLSCGKCFNRKSDLRKHEKVHSG